MTEIGDHLAPYTEFETDAEIRRFAERLHSLVIDNEASLRTRNLVGAIGRYGLSVERAEEKVRKGQEDEDPEHFAVLDFAGDVVGAASRYWRLPLTKPRFGLPLRLAPGLLTARYPFATPEVHAWVSRGNEATLAAAYGDLVAPFQTLAAGMKLPRSGISERPWTLEPTASPRYVHEAIVFAGLKKVATGHFSDGEASLHRPPRATLYAQLQGYPESAIESLRELRTGYVPPVEELDDGMHSSLNPFMP